MRGPFGSVDVHSALAPPRSAGETLIDLSRAGFVTPAGLTTIAAFAQKATDRDRPVFVERPANLDVANYLARARLGRVLDRMEADHNLPGVREHEVGLSLLPLARFRGAGGIVRLADHVHEILHGQSEKAAEILHMSLCAMGENVAEHSGQKRGFVAAQITHHGTQLRFSVADPGHGFRKALSRYEPRSDAQALRLAVRPGVSGIEAEGRGYGLSELLRAVREMGGTLRLRSGRGAYRDGAMATRFIQAFDRRLPVSVLEGHVPIPKRRR